MEQYGYARENAQSGDHVAFSAYHCFSPSASPCGENEFWTEKEPLRTGRSLPVRFSCASIARCGDAPRSIVPALLAWGNQVAESGELVELDILIEKEIPQLLSVKIGRNEPLSRDFLDVGGVV